MAAIIRGQRGRDNIFAAVLSCTEVLTFEALGQAVIRSRIPLARLW
jgi:hypothetical protein